MAITLQMHTRERDEPEPLLPALVRLLVLPVISSAYVLQPDRVPKVYRE
jgi:hypothetical protein